MDALIKVGLPNHIQKYDKLILVLGVKNEDFENSLIGTPYDNLNYLIIGILSFACLEILAAILSCCVGLKVHQLRHFSYHSGKNWDLLPYQKIPHCIYCIQQDFANWIHFTCDKRSIAADINVAAIAKALGRLVEIDSFLLVLYKSSVWHSCNWFLTHSVNFSLSLENLLFAVENFDYTSGQMQRYPPSVSVHSPPLHRETHSSKSTQFSKKKSAFFWEKHSRDRGSQ